MKIFFVAAISSALVLTSSLFAMDGNSFNTLANTYQWDNGMHQQIQELTTDPDDSFDGAILANRFDTRHHHGRKKDKLVAVQFGFADATNWVASLEDLGVNVLPTVGQKIIIGIWDVPDGGNPNSDGAELVHSQKYTVTLDDVGGLEEFRIFAGPFDPEDPLANTGSNVRPINCLGQCAFDGGVPCQHTRRVDWSQDPCEGLDHTRQHTIDVLTRQRTFDFSVYPTRYTTITLDREVTVRGEFFVGIIKDIPNIASDEDPRPTFFFPLAVPVIDATLPKFNGTGMMNNQPIIISDHPIEFKNDANTTSMISAIFADEVYAIRAIAKFEIDED